MNISLPDPMKTFIDEQVAAHGYGSSSEFLRDLVRREQDRQQLRGLLLEGAASPLGEVADDAYFDKVREQIRTRRAA